MMLDISRRYATLVFTYAMLVTRHFAMLCLLPLRLFDDIIFMLH